MSYSRRGGSGRSYLRSLCNMSSGSTNRPGAYPLMLDTKNSNGKPERNNPSSASTGGRYVGDMSDALLQLSTLPNTALFPISKNSSILYLYQAQSISVDPKNTRCLLTQNCSAVDRSRSPPGPLEAGKSLSSKRPANSPINSSTEKRPRINGDPDKGKVSTES